MLQRFGDVLTTAVFGLMLFTIGILKHFPHHIGFFAQSQAEQCRMLGHGHRYARLLTITRQPCQ